jgi:hypothetical protein
MWKIVIVLLATASFSLLARVAYDPPVIQTRVGLSSLFSPVLGPKLSAPLTYAGVRG